LFGRIDGDATVSAKDEGPGDGALSALFARKSDLTSNFGFAVGAGDADCEVGAGDDVDEEAAADIDTAEVVEEGGAGLPLEEAVGVVVGNLSVIVPKEKERASFLACCDC
jgi:hypothetical protein